MIGIYLHDGCMGVRPAPENFITNFI